MINAPRELREATVFIKKRSRSSVLLEFRWEGSLQNRERQNKKSRIHTGQKSTVKIKQFNWRMGKR